MTVPTLKLDSDIGDLTGYGIDTKPTVKRGAGPQQLGWIADAGTLDNYLLDNISRDLDALWTAGPFFGDLRRDIGAVLTATWGATEYEVFVGRVDDIGQSYPNEGTEQLADFSATDLFGWLNRTPINTVRPAERTDQRVAAVLAAIDFPGSFDISNGMSYVCGADLRTVSALSHLADVTQVEYGQMLIDAGGSLTWRGRPAIATDTSITEVQAEYGQDPSVGFSFVDVQRGSLPIANYIELTYGKDGRQTTVSDPTSIAAYGRQPLSVSLPFQTISQARAYGNWLLFRYANPVDTFLSLVFDLELTREPGDDFDLWAEILTRRIGDMVQVTLDPLAGDAPSGEPIVRKQWFLGAEIDFDQGRATVPVQDAWTDGLFYIDSSDIDGPDFIGL